MSSNLKRAARLLQQRADIPYAQALGTIREVQRRPDIISLRAQQAELGVRHHEALVAIALMLWEFE